MTAGPSQAWKARSSRALRDVSSRLRAILGIDLHILQTLLLRGWSVIAGGMMVLFVPRWFSEVEQGYFYTFNSLIAVQIFFELGMNQVVVQIVSHEAAHLQEQADGVLLGARPPLTRLASIMRLLVRWYRVAAGLFFVFGSVAGSVFFLTQGHHADAYVIGLWIVVVLFTSINLYFSPSLAVLEGLGKVGDVARIRMVQSMLGYLVMWSVLALGAGLGGAPVLAGVAALYTGYWLTWRDHRLRWIRQVKIQASDSVLSWRRDVFPFQWRIALSWISGYLILQLLVPIAFSRQGAVAAGRLGLTLVVYSSLLSIGLSWVNARLPLIAGHLARGERAAARAGLRGALVRSTLVTFGSCAVVGGAIELLPQLMRERFADTSTIICLVVATTSNCIIYAMATFVRAHKEEPLVTQSICTAILMVPAIYIGAGISIFALSAIFAAVVLLFAMPWVLLTFLRYYRRT